MKINCLLLFLFLFCNSLAYAVTLTAVPLNGYSNAVCNSGRIANYYFKKAKSKKWFIALQGGSGICTDKESCEEKLKNKKFVSSLYSEKKLKKIKQGAIFNSQALKNYNLVFLPYCSSDLYAGNHTHLLLNNRTMYFRGRAIVVGMFQDLLKKKNLKQAQEMIVAGWSDGAIGVAMNLDVWESLNTKKRYLFDSFWITNGERIFLNNNQIDNTIASFIFKNPPPACRENYLDCYPSNFLLKHKKLDAMIVFNLGDSSYRSGDLEKLKQDLIGDFRLAGGGFSLMEDKTLENGGHIVAANKNFTAVRGDKSFSEIFNNWVSRKGVSIYTNW